MPVVQVAQLVQCVLHKRDTADAGLSYIAPACGGRVLSDQKTGKKKRELPKKFPQNGHEDSCPGQVQKDYL